MDRMATVLQVQLDQFRAYFRDNAGQLEIMAESGDPLLRMVAAYVLVDLTLERRVVMLDDEQFETLTGYTAVEDQACVGGPDA